MNAKQYLKQLFFIDQTVTDSLAELDELRSRATTLGAVDYSKDKIQSGKVSDPTASSVAIIVDLESTIREKISSYRKTKTEVEKTIEGVTDQNVKLVLLKRYVYFKDFDDIATDLKYTAQHVKRLHGQGLENIEKLLLSATKCD